jgi:glycosyltransferase involved in cell wall biosynthesis
MPNVVLEAMSAKLPVIATDVSGTREVVIDKKTGLLIPKADSAAIANAMLTLLDNRDFGKRMGEAGFQRIQESFSVDSMCEKYEQLILSIYEEKTRHAIKV